MDGFSGVGRLEGADLLKPPRRNGWCSEGGGPGCRARSPVGWWSSCSRKPVRAGRSADAISTGFWFFLRAESRVCQLASLSYPRGFGFGRRAKGFDWVGIRGFAARQKILNPDMLFSDRRRNLPIQAERAARSGRFFGWGKAVTRVKSRRMHCNSPEGPPGGRTPPAWKESIHQAPHFAFLIPPVVGESYSSCAGFCSEVIR